MSHILFGLACLLPLVVYYFSSGGSQYALCLLLCGLILFTANVCVSLICTPRSFPRLTLVELLRRNLANANTYARKMENAPMPATDFANYSGSKETLCSATDGSTASKETIKVESSEIGLGQSKSESNTLMSMLSEIDEQANGLNAGQERTESKTEPKLSATSGLSSGPKLVFACCLFLLYIFPVAMVLKINGTTTRTEMQVDKVVIGISSKLSPDVLNHMNNRMAKR